MTPKQEAALRLAREALKYIYEGANNQGPHTGISWRCASNKVQPVIAAIDEVLAEQSAQQQEPVAWIEHGSNEVPSIVVWERGDSGNYTPLYTSPPANKPWRGLTDEEVDECYYWKGRQWTTDELVRHVEAKLREKNA